MLNLKILFNNWWNFFQSGFYFDFFIKKIITVFVFNVFMYTSQFFGEKYLIEVLTKKYFENLVYSLNKYFNASNLTYSWFFLQIFSVLFFILFVFFFLI